MLQFTHRTTASFLRAVAYPLLMNVCLVLIVSFTTQREQLPSIMTPELAILKFSRKIILRNENAATIVRNKKVSLPETCKSLLFKIHFIETGTSSLSHFNAKPLAVMS